ncbi:hypothetical protein Acr_08g0000280 [Actinidia rufa]|uniref:Uncharacterized protein n=1 Tax=Actinidia rufa TaxID=165716 RepID=A0A7J0EYW6_9ERIC|nr:hypothetical protein Acr_08g0000280 [Actinidia rufa]
MWDKILQLRQARRPSTITELVTHDLFEGYLSPNPLDRGKTSPTLSMEPRQAISTELAQSQNAVLLALGRGKILVLINLYQNPIYMPIARLSPPRRRQLRDTLQMAIFPIISPTSPRYLSILILPRISP